MKKTFAEKLGLTEEEYRQLISACGETWGYIAYDIFQAAGTDKIRRSEAIEVTLDAGRVVTGHPQLPEKVKQLLSAYDHDWYKILEAALKTNIFKSTWEYC